MFINTAEIDNETIQLDNRALQVMYHTFSLAEAVLAETSEKNPKWLETIQLMLDEIKDSVEFRSEYGLDQKGEPYERKFATM